jgi:hypothetical protein
MCLSWDGERLMGFLAASGPLDRTSWIRLAALHDHAPGPSTLSCLCDNLVATLGAAGANTVAWLAVNDWIVRYMAGLGFHYLEDVVTLRRTGWQIPPPAAAQVEVRSANPEDLESIRPLTMPHLSHPGSFRSATCGRLIESPPTAP